MGPKNGNKPVASRQDSRPHSGSAGKQPTEKPRSQQNENQGNSDVTMMDVDTQCNSTPNRPPRTINRAGSVSNRADRAPSDPFGTFSRRRARTASMLDGRRSMAPSPPSLPANGGFLGSAESAFRG